MKNLIYVIIALLGGKGLCQDPQLQENTWFLSELNIDGDIVTPPIIELDNKLTITGEIMEIEHDSCEDTIFTIMGDNYVAETGFIAESIENPFDDDCVNPAIQEFFRAHGRFYGDLNTGITINPFSYTIESNTNTLTLTVFNGENNTAIYNNETLSLSNSSLRDVALRYDLKTENLSLSGGDTTSRIIVFDISGQRLLETSLATGAPINMQSFSKGVYLVAINTAPNNNINTFKFVKN